MIDPDNHFRERVIFGCTLSGCFGSEVHAIAVAMSECSPTDSAHERGHAILRCIHGANGREVFETEDRAVALSMIEILDEVASPLMERHPRIRAAAARRADSLRMQLEAA